MKSAALKIVHSKGVTVVEILISVVILAIGVLGIEHMLLFSNKANNSSYTKQQAIQTVNTIFDKIRANSASAINGDYTISNIGTNGMPTTVSTPAAQCNSSSTCTATQLAKYDTWLWLTRDVARLPNGSASIATALNAVTGNTNITVTVQWDDSPAAQVVGAGTQTNATNTNFVQISIQSAL